MTHKTRIRYPSDRPTRPSRPSPGRVGFCLMSTFCFVLILRNSEAAVAYIGRGLTLCARTVIPSLFPFMVISELLVSSGAGEAFGRLFSRLMQWLFGLSGAGASAVFLGSMCGFPMGAKTAVGLLDRNVISKNECEHLLTFTNNPGSAFLITAVGVTLYGNRRLGVLLYATVLGTGFLVGFLSRFFLRRGEHPTEHPHFPSGLHLGGVETFTGAVSGAATSMLTVCAYVIFFSALTGALGCALSEGGGGGVGFTLLSGLLEMTGGISLAATHPDPRWALILTAAFAGWSGFSVHLQVMTLCSGRDLSFRPYLLAKAFQGVLCGGVMAVILNLRPQWINAAEGAVVDAILAFTSLRDISFPALLTNGVFMMGWILSRLGGRGQERG